MCLAASLSLVFMIAASPALSGCTSHPEPKPDSASRSQESSESPGGAQDAPVATPDWLRGSWDATYTLDAVTAAVFEEEAQIGRATIVIEVTGSEMSLLVDGVTYTGVVVFGENAFRFEGATTYEEEDGSLAESDAIMSGTRTGDDSWVGETWADFRSDGEYVYEAAWTQEAVRVR